MVTVLHRLQLKISSIVASTYTGSIFLPRRLQHLDVASFVGLARTGLPPQSQLRRQRVEMWLYAAHSIGYSQQWTRTTVVPLRYTDREGTES